MHNSKTHRFEILIFETVSPSELFLKSFSLQKLSNKSFNFSGFSLSLSPTIKRLSNYLCWKIILLASKSLIINTISGEKKTENFSLTQNLDVERARVWLNEHEGSTMDEIAASLSSLKTRSTRKMEDESLESFRHISAVRLDSIFGSKHRNQFRLINFHSSAIP